MSYHPEAVRILTQLKAIKEQLVGETNFTLGNITVQIKGKDGLGGLIEEWFGHWAKQNGFNVRSPKDDGSSQEFPDYYIWEEPKTYEALLEVKAYDASAGANFDIANFQSYCASVAESPYRLDADYLVFAYKVNNGMLTIHDVYLKKIWEITCASKRWPLKTQTKRNVIYNIRPSTFYSKRSRYPSFTSKDEFIEALFLTEEQYLNQPSENRAGYLENTKIK